MSQRYSRAQMPMSRRQLARMHSAFKSGSPVSLVLGKGGEDVEIDVVLTPKQCGMLEGGGKRIKFSHAQLRKMHGMGVFSDLGEMATPLAEDGISAGINAVAPGLGEVVGPILGEVVGPLIKKVGAELDYAVSKKPNFKQLAKNRSQNVSRAKAYAQASPEQQAAQYERAAQTLSRAPGFVRKAVPKSKAAYDAIQQRNLGLETNEGNIKSAHKAAFMAALDGQGKKCAGGRMKGPGRKPNPRARAMPAGGADIGKQAADYIKKSLLAELKN